MKIAMRTMGKPGFATLLLILCLAAIAVGRLVTLQPTAPLRPEAGLPASASSREELLEALVDRIAAESAGLASELLSIAAPQSPVVPDNASGEPPAPPEGYSFVAEPSQMAMGRLQGRSGDPLPDDFPVWLNAPDAVSVLTDQAAASGRGWTFGWVALADGATYDDLEESLNSLGGEIVGASGRLVRVRLPDDPPRLEEIASLPSVAGLGATPRFVKLPETVEQQARSLVPGEQLPVFVTLMAGDPDGRWRRALEDLGAVVGRFDLDIRTYTATVDALALDSIADADFVLAIEPVSLVEAAHDTAVPAMGVDALRLRRDSPGLFGGTGGASVPIAVMDTGLNINHLDISSHRRSICGANFVWTEPRLSDNDLWVDEDGHGTHVTATIAGNGYVKPEFAGMAPSVSHIRFAKVLSHEGLGYSDTILPGMDYLSRQSGCNHDGSSTNRVKPLIVNMSLSASDNVFEGRGVGERKLDSVVWTHRQLYVVAQSNGGSSAFSNYGTAKNSLSVGAALDSGELANFSSHGPTADGRLAPQVVATGVDVYSARGGGSRGGYEQFSGTSMASPTVAGVAALLMDAAPAHREQPALTRARLMASAVRPESWLEDPARFPADNSNGPGGLQALYGLGKVSARTSVLDRNRTDGWTGGSAISRPEDGDFAWQDIAVPEGASQLTLVMTWDEPPTDTVASAVLNDLDLYLDLDGNCGAGACGEYSSRSRKDNVEWIILKNPPPGVHRAKVVSERIYTEAPRAALAWTVIRGASTPGLLLEADAENPEDPGEITLTLSSDAYVAAGTRLGVTCRTADGLCESDSWSLTGLEVAWEDGLARETDWQGNHLPAISLGEVAAGESQNIKLGVSYRGEDAARLYFTATAWNARPASASVPLDLERQADVPGQNLDSVPAMLKRPANANLASATALTESPQRLDLLLAATEPGEPAYFSRSTWQPQRPLNSVWYEWTAPAEEFYRFDVRPDSEDDGASGDLQLDLFQGDSLGTLERIVPGGGGAVEFFSRAREVYKIRVSHGEGNAPPAILRWSRNAPANDHFADSIDLEGEENSVSGNNQGATLEPGEFFGRLAATVWYRWTAPADGDWRFDSGNDDLRTLAFIGDRPSELRLVSGFPESSAEFPARSGQEYRIAVAAEDAFGGGGSFDLSWSPAERHAGNDDFQDAEDIGNAESSTWSVDMNNTSTVEPDEPLATGVRTKWLQWTAPEDGFYTWRLFEPYNDSPASSSLAVAVFSGESLTDLEPVGAIGQNRASSEFVIRAVEDRRYSISLGFRNDVFAAFHAGYIASLLRWGPTPANDNADSAEELTGASGDVSGSAEFATTEPDGRGGQGLASLWYSYEAPASGWVRFFVDEGQEEEEGEEAAPKFSLAVYRRSGGVDLRVAENRNGGAYTPDATFEVEAGVRYLIRLGTLGNDLGGDFTLRWEESAAPAWLKYLGELNDGDQDKNGHAIQLDMPWRTSLTFNSDGTALYVVTEAGLQVFERDPESGELSFAQSLEIDGNPALSWDSRQPGLYAHDCDGWQRFEPVDDDQRRLGNAMQAPVSGEPRYYCAGDALVTDSTGTFIHAVSRWNGLEVYALTASGLEHVQSVELENIRQVLVSNSNRHLYALTENSLHVYERDTETGKLTPARNVSVSTSSVMAISDDDRYLFAVGPEGSADASVYRLELGADPMLLDELAEVPPNPPWKWSNCEFAAPRKGLAAADIFCNGFAFGLQWRPDAEQLVHTDYLEADELDRFDNLVRDFGDILAGAASPDGKHAYVAAEEAGEGMLVTFERVNNAEGHRSTTPVLTAAASVLRLPMIEYRGETGPLCFAAEFRGTAGFQNIRDAGNWTLVAADPVQCAAATGDVPFVEADTSVLRIPYGKFLNEDELTCFTTELQASEDYRNWTPVASNRIDCR